MNARTLTRANYRPRLMAVGVGLALSSLFVLPAIANGSAKPATKYRTPLERGLGFYRDNTLTYVDHSTPGTAPDENGRTIAQYVGMYLHATVNVEDISGGNTVTGEDVLAHAAPNGLTFGNVNLIGSAGDILTHVPSINFNPARLEFVGALQAAPQLIVALSSSPYTTLASIRDASPAPKFLMQSSGESPVETASILGVLGFHEDYVTGYSSLSSYVAGFVRGDGALIETGLGTLTSYIASGVARPLFTVAVAPVGTVGRQYTLEVPDLKTAEKEYPPTTKLQKKEYAALNAFLSTGGSTDVTQTSVPAYNLTRSRAAEQWMVKQPGFISTELQDGNNPKYVSPEVSKHNYIEALKVGATLVPYFSQF